MDGNPALLNAAIQGDITALSDLMRSCAAELRAAIHIQPRWRSALDVDDVLQVTYLEAFLRIGSFTPAGAHSFLAWLRRIADNNVRDAIKGLQRQKRPPPARRLSATTEDSVLDLCVQLGVTTTTPSRVAARKELHASLETALQALPDDYARVIRAYDLEGRTIAETAALAGRSAGAVHMMRARAHARLRELLSAHPDLRVEA